MSPYRTRSHCCRRMARVSNWMVSSAVMVCCVQMESKEMWTCQATQWLSDTESTKERKKKKKEEKKDRKVIKRKEKGKGKRKET